MPTILRRLSQVLLLIGLMAGTAAAQEYVVGSYRAHIGLEDLSNSRGARLGDAAQVLRQDRANVHRFGITHAGDESEPWFSQPELRAAMAALLQAGGGIDAATARYIMGGNVDVIVTLFAVDGNFSALQVTVPGAQRAAAPSPGGPLDVTIYEYGGDGQAAECGLFIVAGLQADGDGFLAVRSGPGTQYPMIDKVYNGDYVVVYDDSNGWLGGIYGRGDAFLRGSDARGCGFVGSGRRPLPYPGKKGWMHSKWLRIVAG